MKLNLAFTKRFCKAWKKVALNMDLSTQVAFDKGIISGYSKLWAFDIVTISQSFLSNVFAKKIEKCCISRKMFNCLYLHCFKT